MKKFVLAIIASALVMSLAACGDAENTGNSSAASSEQESSVVSVSNDSSSSEDSAASEESSGEKTELQLAFEKVKAEVELPEDMVDFDERRLKRVFGITEEQAEDFAGAICTDGLKQDEIIIVKAKDEEAAKDVEERLQNDWQSKYNVIKNYDPDQVEIIENAEVVKNGLYVSLIISPDADKIMSIFNENIG